MAANTRHPDWYFNFPTAPEHNHQLTGGDQLVPGVPEVGVEPLAVDEAARFCEDGDDVGSLQRVEEHPEVASDTRRIRAERHPDVASGDNAIEVDLSYPGRGRGSRELLEERPNKRQYTHSCVCAEKQASLEAKQVIYEPNSI